MPVSRELLRKFIIYHAENPQIWKKFEEITLESVKRKRRFSARAIFHIMRWETPVGAKDDEYKISNNHSPYYARMFAKKYKLHKRFFRTCTIGWLTAEDIPDG